MGFVCVMLGLVFSIERLCHVRLYERIWNETFGIKNLFFVFLFFYSTWVDKKKKLKKKLSSPFRQKKNSWKFWLIILVSHVTRILFLLAESCNQFKTPQRSVCFCVKTRWIWRAGSFGWPESSSFLVSLPSLFIFLSCHRISPRANLHTKHLDACVKEDTRGVFLVFFPWRQRFCDERGLRRWGDEALPGGGDAGVPGEPFFTSDDLKESYSQWIARYSVQCSNSRRHLSLHCH